MQRSTLSEYADFYVRLLDGSSGYFDQLRWAISRFDQWAGRSIYIDELTEQMVNDYLVATKECLAPQTRINRRNMLLRLWRHSSTNPALIVRPAMLNRDLIGKVRRRQKSPRGWPIEDVRKLFITADGLKGAYATSITKRLWWRAYILGAWSSGLRRCDLMSLKRADVPATGKVAIVQVKTGRHVIGNFSEEAMAALCDFSATHRSEFLFPLWCRVSTWRKIARRLVKRAGLGLSIGHLRHSAGTAVENLFPGKGPQFLGNTPAVFYAHYLDRTLATDLPQPPPLCME
jgi:integrase